MFLQSSRSLLTTVATNSCSRRRGAPLLSRAATFGDETTTAVGKRRRLPRKPPIQLTKQAQTTLSRLLQMTTATTTSQNDEEHSKHILLDYHQSSREPRMVFALKFATELHPLDEGVDLGLENQQLYVSHRAFMKVLGSTMDIPDPTTMIPTLTDREGNPLDPNA